MGTVVLEGLGLGFSPMLTALNALLNKFNKTILIFCGMIFIFR
jgi:hypothetical protein